MDKSVKTIKKWDLEKTEGMQKQKQSTKDKIEQKTYLSICEADEGYKIPLLTPEYLQEHNLW